MYSFWPAHYRIFLKKIPNTCFKIALYIIILKNLICTTIGLVEVLDWMSGLKVGRYKNLRKQTKNQHHTDEKEREIKNRDDR
jgi:hypothetical protein